jgi:alkylation response protein AidB-like acyl-CoA dehydrogenase
VAARARCSGVTPRSHSPESCECNIARAVCKGLGHGRVSTAMCDLMYSCATAVIAAKATLEQAVRWLRPVAVGRLLATLTLSERRTGLGA